MSALSESSEGGEEARPVNLNRTRRVKPGEQGEIQHG